MAPVQRGWISAFVDRVFAWWCGLPGESCSYTVESLRIPIGDGLNLAADLYQPTINKPHGTILVRTSYGLAPLMALGHARLFAPRGYQVLFAACRGTDPLDGGELVPAVNEAADGLATVAWMREQPWYTGSFAMCGGSYLGYTQWAVLSDPPADMKAAVISSGPHNFGAFVWGTGAMDAHMLSWADLMTCSKRGYSPVPSYIKKQPEVLRPVYDGVPLMDAIDKHFQNEAPEWLHDGVSHSDLTSPLYLPMNQRQAVERAKLPILQFTGWNDVALTMVTEQHEMLTKRGCPATLVIGPWSHLGSQRGTRLAEGFHFIEEHLAKRGNIQQKAPVRVFVTGAKQWRELEKWPPAPVSTYELYLGSNKSLSRNEPASDAPDSTFKFDPAESTPNIGMPRPFDDLIPASYDDTALALRSDVLVFTSAPLDVDLEVCGQPNIELNHSSNHPFVDLLVRLSDVDGKGRSTRISERYMRLDPARGAGPLSISLSDCAHRFRKGSKIRVILAGGAHPAYIRNLGTGENPATGATMRPAWHTVRHSSGAISKLALPVTA